MLHCWVALLFISYSMLAVYIFDVVLITVLRKIFRGVACYHYRLIYCFPNNYCFRREPFGKFLPRTVHNTTISDIKRRDTWTERFCLWIIEKKLTSIYLSISGRFNIALCAAHLWTKLQNTKLLPINREFNLIQHWITRKVSLLLSQPNRSRYFVNDCSAVTHKVCLLKYMWRQVNITTNHCEKRIPMITYLKSISKHLHIYIKKFCDIYRTTEIVKYLFWKVCVKKLVATWAPVSYFFRKFVVLFLESHN